MDDFIDIPDEVAPAAPPPTAHSPVAPGRKRIFAPTPPKVRPYERRDRERDDRRGRPIEAYGAPQEAPGRVPPNSDTSEAHLLGACMQFADVLSLCVDGKIKPESFYGPANRVIYGKLVGLYQAKLPTEIGMLMEVLKESGQLEEVGGFGYLAMLERAATTTAQTRYHIKKVRELARLRDIIRAATDTVERCYGFTGPEDFPSIIAPLSVAWEEDASISERLALRMIDVDGPPPVIESRLGIAGRAICTPGNLTAIIAQAKAGKTTFVGGALTAIIAKFYDLHQADTLGWESAHIGKRVVIYIDTELAIKDHDIAMKRVKKRAGVSKKPEWLWNYCLTGWSVDDKRMALQSAIDKAQREGREIFAIFIDGIAHLAKSVNDEEETAYMVTMLRDMSIQTDAPVICIMHRNEGEKADSTGRGHLGKQLAREVESNLRLEKRDGVSFVFADQNRGAPIDKGEGPAFKWNEAQLMHTSITPDEKERFLAEMEEANAPRRRSGGGGGEGKPKNIKRTYTEQEFLAQFPFGEKAAQPLGVIRKKAVSNLCISDAKFGDERFNMMTAGKINKVTMPNGEDRYFR